MTVVATAKLTCTGNPAAGSIGPRPAARPAPRTAVVRSSQTVPAGVVEATGSGRPATAPAPHPRQSRRYTTPENCQRDTPTLLHHHAVAQVSEQRALADPPNRDPQMDLDGFQGCSLPSTKGSIELPCRGDAAARSAQASNATCRCLHGPTGDQRTHRRTMRIVEAQSKLTARQLAHAYTGQSNTNSWFSLKSRNSLRNSQHATRQVIPRDESAA